MCRKSSSIIEPSPDFPHKWYKNESYEILSFGATKEDWESFSKLVTKTAKYLNKGTNKTVKQIAKNFSKVSAIANYLTLPVTIVYLLISDASKQLKKDLEKLEAKDWFQMNWYVKCTYQDLFTKHTTSYLQAYCLMALLSQGAVNA